MRENQGLDIGTIAPNIQSFDVRTGTQFDLLDMAHHHQGIFLNFIRNNA